MTNTNKDGQVRTAEMETQQKHLEFQMADVTTQQGGAPDQVTLQLISSTYSRAVSMRAAG